MNDPDSRSHKPLSRTDFEIRLFNHCSDFQGPIADLDFTDAVIEAVLSQPPGWNVRAPQSPWARMFLEGVKSRVPAADADYVAFYLSINCALARYYSVSAFLMLQRHENRLGLATIALKTGSHRMRPDACKHFIYTDTTSHKECLDMCTRVAARLMKKQRGLLRASGHYGVSLLLPPPSAPGPA